MTSVDLDQATFEAIDTAARLTGMTHAGVIARLIQQTRVAAPAVNLVPVPDQTADIYADYEGHRTLARFDRQTNRVDILDGPLVGQSFKTPTGAARAVVGHYKPGVSPHRNGWSFWLLVDGSGALQSIRHSA